MALMLATAALQAQERRRSLGPYTMYEQIVYQAKQERLMTWLAHDMNHGRATGTRASVLSPSTPSASRSTEIPVPNAASMAAGVPAFNGMHSTIAGRMVT